MTKLDRTYQSLYRHMSHIHPFPEWLHNIYKSQWTLVGSVQPRSKTDMLKGAFQPLADMLKDAKDILKPYGAGWRGVLKDALQPLYGLGNLLKGIFYLVAIIPLFLFNFLRYALKANSFSQWVDMALVFNGIRTISWFIDGLLSIVRGATQIAATPLGWIKMLVRAIITACTDEKNLLIENKPSIQALVSEAKVASNQSSWDSYMRCSTLMAEIHRKYQKGVDAGWNSGITATNENALYSNQANDAPVVHRPKYFALFQPEPEKVPATPENNQLETENLVANKQ